MSRTPDALRTGLVCNPESGLARKSLQKIREIADRIPDITYRETGNADRLKTTFDEFRDLDIELLVIIGGDGTVQAILNHLLSRPDYKRLPFISIIPAGTTNMTAKDLGFRGNPDQLLNRIGHMISHPNSGKQITRPALCINQADRPTIYGMFFGAGMIASGSKYFHHHIKKSGLTGEFTSVIVILRLLAGLLFKSSSNDLKPALIQITEDSGPTQQRTCLILFASTMNRLLLGIRPYWGREDEPMRTTYITASCARLWRSLLAMLTGYNASLKEERGYYSHNNRTLELVMDEDFIVDGEFFRCDSRFGALRISVTENIVFLVPGKAWK